jgi:hypothetical protein
MKQGTLTPNARKRASRIVQWVRAYRNRYGYDPSFDEVAVEFKTSTSVISRYREIMVRHGMMREVPHGIERAWPMIETT